MSTPEPEGTPDARFTAVTSQVRDLLTSRNIDSSKPTPTAGLKQHWDGKSGRGYEISVKTDLGIDLTVTTEGETWHLNATTTRGFSSLYYLKREGNQMREFGAYNMAERAVEMMQRGPNTQNVDPFQKFEELVEDLGV